MTLPNLFIRVLCALAALASLARADQYKILVTDVSLAAKKRVGAQTQPWDLDGAPDVYVVVAIDGRPVYVSGVAKNALRARWFTGTEYWRMTPASRITITVRDADAGKMVASVGMAGVAVRPDIPEIGKKVISDALAKVDTDDTVAVWSGSLAQLRAKDLARSCRVNAGLTSLKVRVIKRTATASKQYFGLSGAVIEKTKRDSKTPWDVGLGAAQRPDPRCLVYVNGSPVLAGGVNKDTLIATWSGAPGALALRADDTVAVAIYDADAGSRLAAVGKIATLYSDSLSADAKRRMFETLNGMRTDDLIFLWVGDWKTLARTPVLPAAQDTNVWVNNGLVRATVTTQPPERRAAGASFRLTVESATIAAKKSNGKSWDMGAGKPDPLVRCYVAKPGGGWKLLGATTPLKDTLSPAWNTVLGKERVRAGAKVRFEIYDKDGMSDDPIGTILVTLSATRGAHTVSTGPVRLVYTLD